MDATVWKPGRGEGWWFIPTEKFGLGVFSNSHHGRGGFASAKATAAAKQAGYRHVTIDPG